MPTISYGEFEVVIAIRTLDIIEGSLVRFADGTRGEVDMMRLVHSERAGVFASLRDTSVFESVYVEHGAVAWPNEVDLAPDALHASIRADGRCELG